MSMPPEPDDGSLERARQHETAQLSMYYRPRYQMTPGSRLSEQLGQEEGVSAIYLSKDELEKMRHRLWAIDIEEQLDKVTMLGLEQLPFSMTEDEIRSYIISNIPALAVARVESIGFAHDLALEGRDIADDEDTMRGYHFYDQSTKTSRIGLMLDPLVILNERGGSDLAKQVMLGTLDHEIGHAFEYSLPLELLRIWHGTVTRHPAYVSSYVAGLYEQDSKFKYADDLADSFSLFVSKPDQLLEASSERFFAMYDLFGHTRRGHMTARELLVDIDKNK